MLTSVFGGAGRVRVHLRHVAQVGRAARHVTGVRICARRLLRGDAVPCDEKTKVLFNLCSVPVSHM